MSVSRNIIDLKVLLVCVAGSVLYVPGVAGTKAYVMHFALCVQH